MEFRDVRRLTGIGITPYRITGAAPGTHIGLPSPTITLIVDLGTGLTLSTHDAEIRTFRVAVGGIHLQPVTIHHDGTQIGVALDLTPAALRAIFGVRARDLRATNLDLADLTPALSRRLYDELGAAPAARQADLCARLLGESLDTDALQNQPPDAHRMWHLLARRRGRIRVAEMAERSGWSRRRLTTVFTAEYGMGPKQAARLFRFDHARRRLEAGGAIADVAAACGYADQAHLTREFRDFTGHPPREFLTVRAAEFAGADRC
ncbi:helix-turn-helix domain-containing protein [Gordonia iterans]